MADRIEDFGEKIGGARKDMWKGRSLGLYDLVQMNDLEMVKFVKKDDIWPKPDYEDMVATMIDDEVLRAKAGYMAGAWEEVVSGFVFKVKQIRDSIRQPQRGWSRDGYERYIRAVTLVNDGIQRELENHTFGLSHMLPSVFGGDIVIGSGYSMRLNRSAENYDKLVCLGAKFIREIQVGPRALSDAISRASVEYTDDQGADESARLLISSQSHVFWHPKRSEQRALWDSTLELSEDFAREILGAPVPIDMRVFHALSKSPLAMDVYTWLTYRMFVLRRSGRPFVLIPWEGLKMQFGSGYADTAQGLYNFKEKFKKRLREVLTFYPEARSCIEDDKKSGCLKLRPARLHIPHQKKKAIQG